MTKMPRRVNASQSAYAAPASKRKVHRLTPEDLVRAKELLEKGLSYGEAARKLGCTDGALRNRLPGFNRKPGVW